MNSYCSPICIFVSVAFTDSNNALNIKFMELLSAKNARLAIGQLSEMVAEEKLLISIFGYTAKISCENSRVKVIIKIFLIGYFLQQTLI